MCKNIVTIRDVTINGIPLIILRNAKFTQKKKNAVFENTSSYSLRLDLFLFKKYQHELASKHDSAWIGFIFKENSEVVIGK